MELLRCMYWNESSYSYVDDGTCSFTQIWDDIPCLTCAENEYINTTVYDCRCLHMSRFAAVYAKTYPNKGAGVATGVYSNFML